MARLLGVAAPSGLHGRDLLAGAGEPRPAVLETSNGIGPDGTAIELVAVRTTRWKLVETPALERRELYDLSVDPGERDDHAASAPEIAHLASILDTWRGATPPVVAPTDPRVAERLRALGYAQ